MSLSLVSGNTPHRGGGGTIGFVRHVTGFNFVQTIKMRLDTINTSSKEH